MGILGWLAAVTTGSALGTKLEGTEPLPWELAKAKATTEHPPRRVSVDSDGVGSTTLPFFLGLHSLLTSKRQVSARQKVPDLPMPALQCTTMGPCSGLREPDSRTLKRKLRKEAGDSGTPKSGHVV